METVSVLDHHAVNSGLRDLGDHTDSLNLFNVAEGSDLKSLVELVGVGVEHAVEVDLLGGGRAQIRFQRANILDAKGSIDCALHGHKVKAETCDLTGVAVYLIDRDVIGVIFAVGDDVKANALVVRKFGVAA